MSATMMTYVPQLAKAAKTVEEAVAGQPSVLEPKLDGWRVQFERVEDGFAIWTRSGGELAGKMPEIEADLAWLPVGTVLDGEVIAYERGESGAVHSWGSVQSVLGANIGKARARSHVLSYAMFDVLAWSGRDLRGEKFWQRRNLLTATETLWKGSTRVELVPQFPALPEEYDRLLAQGYEGGVVKWLNSPYASGQRGKGWWKLKASATVDVIVTGFTAGKGELTGLVGAVEFGQMHDGRIVERGRCSGMDEQTRLDMTENGPSYLGRVMEIAHMGVMPPHEGKPFGAFRHPQFKRMRLDRDAASVVVHDG